MTKFLQRPCVAALWTLVATTTALQAQDREETWTLHTATTNVDYGAKFDLRVVRTWPATIAPSPFPQDALAPLRLELVDVAYAESAGRMTETRRFSARAFAVGEVRVGSADGAFDPLVLQVRSSLDAASKEAELDLPLLPPAIEPAPKKSHWVLALIIGSALAGIGWLRRKFQVPINQTTRKDITQRLHETRDCIGLADSANTQRDAVVSFSALVRVFIAQQTGVVVVDATHDELRDRLKDSTTAEQRSALDPMLAAIDAALYEGRPDRKELMATIELWMIAWGISLSIATNARQAVAR